MSKQFEEVQNMASRSQSSEDSESDDVSSSENEYKEKLDKLIGKIAKESERLKEEESKIYDMFIQFCTQSIIEKIMTLMTCENSNTTKYFTIIHDDIEVIIKKFYNYTPYNDYLKKVCDKHKFPGVCSWHHISCNIDKYKGKKFYIKLNKIEDITDNLLRLQKSKKLYGEARRKSYNVMIENIVSALRALDFQGVVPNYYGDEGFILIKLDKLFK